MLQPSRIRVNVASSGLRDVRQLIAAGGLAFEKLVGS